MAEAMSDAVSINDENNLRGQAVTMVLTTGMVQTGVLLDTFSGEGQTDGLLLIKDRSGNRVHVYERHIVLIMRSNQTEEH